jgi:hypothetical protein
MWWDCRDHPEERPQHRHRHRHGHSGEYPRCCCGHPVGRLSLLARPIFIGIISSVESSSNSAVGGLKHMRLLPFPRGRIWVAARNI